MDNRNNGHLFTCKTCGARFSPDASGGVCPYCHTSNTQWLHTQQRQYLKQQARKKQLKKAAMRLSAALVVLIAVIVGIISLVSHIIRGNETVIFQTEKTVSSPLFFTDSDGKVYFVGKDTTPQLIGKGEVTAFCSSEKNKLTYFVFEGTRDLDSLTGSGSSLLCIQADGSVKSVAEYPYGKITFVQGGNCDYLYYLINETLSSYQNSSRLYLYRSGDKTPKKIADYTVAGAFSNFRVSPNGHYLLYKAQDDGGTKLMRYSVKSGTSESLGIKNAEPVSIDNKGRYYSYLKLNDAGFVDFYTESSVSDREKTGLNVTAADRILVSADGRSFVVETGSITLVKSIGSEAVSIAARTGSGIGLEKYPLLSAFVTENPESSGVHEVVYTANKSFFPYYYFSYETNGSRTLMCCEKDGSKRSLTENAFTDFCTNGSSAAYINENALYTLVLGGTTSPTLISENFEGYTLCALSDNGKYIFYRDTDGNLYRIPFDYTGRDWIKMAVDANPFILSSDGRTAAYFSDGALYYGKDAGSYKVSERVSPGRTYVMNNCGKLYYLAESENSKAQDALSLYFYDGKKSVLIADNILSIQAYPHLSAGFVDLPYSSFVETAAADINQQMDALTDGTVTDGTAS